MSGGGREGDEANAVALPSSPLDPVFVLAEVRIASERCFVPFCTNAASSSNALDYAPRESLRSTLLHQSGTCQFHRPTSSVLGVERESWHAAEVSIRGTRLLITPSTLALPLPSADNLWQRLRSRRSRWPEASWVDLDARTSIFVSRLEPRIVALLLAPTDGMIVFHAHTAADALQWVSAVGGVLAEQRDAEPVLPRTPLREVVVGRDRRIHWPRASADELDLTEVSVEEKPPPPLRDASAIRREGVLEVLQLVDAAETVRLGLPLPVLSAAVKGVEELSAEAPSPAPPSPVADVDAEAWRDGWEVREVQLEWFGILCGHWRPLLNPKIRDPSRRFSAASMSQLRPSGSLLSRRRSSVHGAGGTSTAPLDPRGHHHGIRVDFEREACTLFAVPAEPRVFAVRHGPRDCLLLLRAASAAEARAWGEEMMSCLVLGKGDEYACSLWLGGDEEEEEPEEEPQTSMEVDMEVTMV